MIFDNILTLLENATITTQFFVAFAVPWVLSDLGPHTLGILSGKGDFPLWIALVAPLLSDILIESLLVILFFFLKNKEWAKRKLNILKKNKIYASFAQFDSISLNEKVTFLLAIRPLPGTRILIVVFVALTSLSFKDALPALFFSSFVWYFFIVLFGFFVGKSLNVFFSNNFGIFAGIYALILIFVIRYLVKKSNIFMREKVNS